MTIHLLPTAEIVTEFKQYDPLFYFYDDGIRGVVRDAVLHCSGGDPEAVRTVKEVVMQKVQDEIDRHDLLRYYENTHGNDLPTLIIELIIEQITDVVKHLMDTLFQGHLYNVSPSRRQEWLGDDLMVVILLRTKHVTRHRYS